MDYQQKIIASVSAVGVFSMPDAEDLDGIAEVVKAKAVVAEAKAVVAEAEAQFGRVDVLEHCDIAFFGLKKACQAMK